MTALTSERDTSQYNDAPLPAVLTIPVKATAVLFAGGLACIDSTGQALPGATATGLIAVGRTRRTIDNSDGADGAVDVDVERGVFKFDQSATSGGDLITQAMLLGPCYVVDDATVAATNGSGTRSRAGIIISVDPDGVFVQVGA